MNTYNSLRPFLLLRYGSVKTHSVTHRIATALEPTAPSYYSFISRARAPSFQFPCTESRALSPRFYHSPTYQSLIYVSSPSHRRDLHRFSSSFPGNVLRPPVASPPCAQGFLGKKTFTRSVRPPFSRRHRQPLSETFQSLGYLFPF